MRRFARHSLYLVLAVSFTLPHTSLAAPTDGQDAGIWSRIEAWLSQLWGPAAGTINGCADGEGGPGSDPNGAAACAGAAGTPPPATTQGAPTAGSGEGDYGPTSDPDG